MKANIMFCLILAFVLFPIGCEKKPAETGGALIQAAKIGDIDRVRSLISSGVDVNITDQWGNTPLLLALQGEYRDVAILLVAKGADVNVKSPPQTYAVGRSRHGGTPLHYAARSGFKHVAELMITKGADVNARSAAGSWTPLHHAAVMGHKDVVELLIAEGAEIDAKDHWHRTPLLLAADSLEGGSVAELLVAKGADVSAMDNNGFTPLLCALHRCNENLAELLITRSADVNVGAGIRPPSPPAPGPGPVMIIHTPLHYAARLGYLKVVELLIAKGANVNAKNLDGDTPLYEAIACGHKEIVELLRKHGAKE